LPVVADTDNRNAGVVYLDENASEEPRTHVLIVGVGRYRKSSLFPDVESPSLSARALATWFLEGAQGIAEGFNNPHRPLGSLAALLSEHDDPGTLAIVEGVPVPRATFTNVRLAIRAWFERAQTGTHPEKNLLVLYFVGHGETVGSRLVFNFEDARTDDLEETSGSIAIDSLVQGLEASPARDQLLMFDCCSTFSAWDTDKVASFPVLIQPGGKWPPGSRQQLTMRASLPRTVSAARRGRQTLFMEALLKCLSGLAADPSKVEWPVTTDQLHGAMNALLDLYSRSLKFEQLPFSQAPGAFAITFPGEPEHAKAFISIKNMDDWQHSELRITQDGVSLPPILGNTTEMRFAELDLKETPAKITLSQGGVSGATETLRPRKPRWFPVLGSSPVTHVTGGAARGGSATDRTGKLALELKDPLGVGQAVVTMTKVGGEEQVRFVLRSNEVIHRADIEPGRWWLDFALADGSRIEEQVEVERGRTVGIMVTPTRPPPALGLDGNIVSLNRMSDFAVSASDPPSLPTDALPLSLVPRVGFSPTTFPVGLSALRLSPPTRDPKLRVRWAGSAVFEVDDLKIAQRLPARFNRVGDSTRAADDPAWITAHGEGWTEVAAVPSLGLRGGRIEDGGWSVTLEVDPNAQPARSRVTAQVRSRQWSSLLSFLASRDFASSETLFSQSPLEAREALLYKVNNPIAACAGAIAAVATGRLERLEIPKGWLINLSNFFPGLPDGAVILARHALVSGRKAEAKQMFREAFGRGIPIYSVALEWLAQGLMVLADDEDTNRLAAAARRMSDMSDPARVFTVLRLPTST